MCPPPVGGSPGTAGERLQARLGQSWAPGVGQQPPHRGAAGLAGAPPSASRAHVAFSPDGLQPFPGARSLRTAVYLT